MDFTSLLDKSPGAIAVLILVVSLFLAGKVVTESACDKREAKVLAQLEAMRKERDEWKDLYFAQEQISRRGVNAAERRLKPR